MLGLDLPELVGRGERPATGGRVGVRAVLDLFLAYEFGEVAKRFRVGDAGEEHAGAVVVDHGQGLVAVAGARLGDVVED